MQIEVNGEQRKLADGTGLQGLLESEGLAGRRLAVERNGEIVPRSQYAQTALQPGDRLEIVHAIGGG